MYSNIKAYFTVLVFVLGLISCAEDKTSPAKSAPAWGISPPLLALVDGRSVSLENLAQWENPMISTSDHLNFKNEEAGVSLTVISQCLDKENRRYSSHWQGSLPNRLNITEILPKEVVPIAPLPEDYSLTCEFDFAAIKGKSVHRFSIPSTKIKIIENTSVLNADNEENSVVNLSAAEAEINEIFLSCKDFSESFNPLQLSQLTLKELKEKILANPEIEPVVKWNPVQTCRLFFLKDGSMQSFSNSFVMRFPPPQLNVYTTPAKRLPSYSGRTEMPLMEIEIHNPTLQPRRVVFPADKKRSALFDGRQLNTSGVQYKYTPQPARTAVHFKVLTPMEIKKQDDHTFIEISPGDRVKIKVYVNIDIDCWWRKSHDYESGFYFSLDKESLPKIWMVKEFADPLLAEDNLVTSYELANIESFWIGKAVKQYDGKVVVYPAPKTVSKKKKFYCESRS